jgi:hypothetical protein
MPIGGSELGGGRLSVKKSRLSMCRNPHAISGRRARENAFCVPRALALPPGFLQPPAEHIEIVRVTLGNVQKPSAQVSVRPLIQSLRREKTQGDTTNKFEHGEHSRPQLPLIRSREMACCGKPHTAMHFGADLRGAISCHFSNVSSASHLNRIQLKGFELGLVQDFSGD